MKYMLFATCCFYAFSALAGDLNAPRNPASPEQRINEFGIPSLNRRQRRAVLNGNKSRYNQSPFQVGHKGSKSRVKK